MTVDKRKLAEFQDRIGYHFSSESLLVQALTHSSLASDKSDNYERLEFLGDRVLGLIVAQLLYEFFLNESEGILARRFAKLVSRDALVEIAASINLPEYIRVSASEKRSQTTANAAIQSDCCEALVAAIYLDGGFSEAENFIKKFWGKNLFAPETSVKDAKSRLQEWVQAKGLPLPEYTLLESEGPAHDPLFKIEVKILGRSGVVGVGGNKREASLRAAKSLLAILESEDE